MTTPAFIYFALAKLALRHRTAQHRSLGMTDSNVLLFQNNTKLQHTYIASKYLQTFANIIDIYILKVNERKQCGVVAHMRVAGQATCPIGVMMVNSSFTTSVT